MNKQKNNTLSTNIHTRNIEDLIRDTKNVYEVIAIISKRANQISVREKEELLSKLKEFETTSDNLEEIFENREQIEISKFYERKPKPTTVSLQEFGEDNIYYRYPNVEKETNETE